jgi:hypothetical protein
MKRTLTTLLLLSGLAARFAPTMGQAPVTSPAGTAVEQVGSTPTIIKKDADTNGEDETALNEEFPVRISIGTNLNVIDRKTTGPNLYFDLMWMEAAALRIPREKMVTRMLSTGKVTEVKGIRQFGGYVRVFQQQATTTLGLQSLRRIQRADLNQPVYTPIGGVKNDSISLQREMIRIRPREPVVRVTGIALGGTILALTDTNLVRGSIFNLGMGLHIEALRREISVYYDRASLFRDTVRLSIRQYLNMPDSSTTRSYEFIDAYLGLSFPVEYRLKTLEMRAVPSFGYASVELPYQEGSRREYNKFEKSIYAGLYLSLMERKYGFSIGCDLRALPLTNTALSFNIFASKVFRLDKVADALGLQ